MKPAKRKVPSVVQQALHRVAPSLVFLPAGTRSLVARAVRLSLPTRSTRKDALSRALFAAGVALFFHRELPAQEQSETEGDCRRSSLEAFAARYEVDPPGERFYTGAYEERLAEWEAFTHRIQKSARALHRYEVRVTKEVAEEAVHVEAAAPVPIKALQSPMFRTRLVEAFADLYFGRKPYRKEVP